VGMVEMRGRCIKYIHTTTKFFAFNELRVVVVMVEMFFPKSIESKRDHTSTPCFHFSTVFPAPGVFRQNIPTISTTPS